MTKSNSRKKEIYTPKRHNPNLAKFLTLSLELIFKGDKMKQEEARKLFDKDKFEEISLREWFALDNDGEFAVRCKDDLLYFKPKSQYPIIFEDNYYEFAVTGFNCISISNKIDFSCINIGVSFDLLDKAVQKAKEKI